MYKAKYISSLFILFRINYEKSRIISEQRNFSTRGRIKKLMHRNFAIRQYNLMTIWIRTTYVLFSNFKVYQWLSLSICRCFTIKCRWSRNSKCLKCRSVKLKYESRTIARLSTRESLINREQLRHQFIIINWACFRDYGNTSRLPCSKR